TKKTFLCYVFFTACSGTFDSFILEFSGRARRKSARLRHKFPGMEAVTVCTRVLFEPTCEGFSTVFSYSAQAFINEFQLRAQVMDGDGIQLALFVHGEHSALHPVIDNDASWHSVCVSWASSGGAWALWVDGVERHEGTNLYPGKSIGGDGVFIVGQEQDTYGGSLKAADSFCGSVTELHIWNRVLNASEIKAMEKECSPLTSGLLFKWNASALEMEGNSKYTIIPCEF
uniref:Pentraxin family member n=1 Tax=Denticeps clupeoides TaxID=299321 RepID=A0AAY4EZH0_9TELE